jgi:hypothetical protein
MIFVLRIYLLSHKNIFSRISLPKLSSAIE